MTEMTALNTCSCGGGTIPTVSAAPCECGCGGCATASTRDEEVAELRRLLDSVSERLTELGAR